MPGEGLLPLDIDHQAGEPVSAEAAAAAAVPVTALPPAVVDDVSVAAAPTVSAEPPAIEGDTPSADVTVATGAPLSPQPLPPAIALFEPVPATRSAADELLETFRHSALGERVEVTARPGAVSLEISDNILFTPASAALSVDGMALLDQLAGVLRTLPYTLSVEGHTDNVPIHTHLYPSNWELSAARAAMVTRKLIEQGVAAPRVRAIGYGDTRPRTDNQTPEGRAKNRRVTFVLQVDAEAG
jgi:chemotaxis protein MotB